MATSIGPSSATGVEKVRYIKGSNVDVFHKQIMSTVQSTPSSLELEFLNTEVATRYISWSATTIPIWDILTHLSDDIELLVLYQSFRPPTIAYFISRYTLLAFFVFTQFAANIESKCTAATTAKAVAIVLNTLGYIAIITTLLQFYIRVRAVFRDNLIVKWFFTLLWMLAAGGTSPLISGATQGICNSDFSFYSYYIPVISVLVHDSCVFVAISYRICQISMGFTKQPSLDDLLSAGWDGMRNHMMEILWGKNLPSPTRALLLGGQLYYLISLTCSITTLALALDTSLLSQDRLLLTPMHALVLNITTGHVFREIRLGRMPEQGILSVYQCKSQVQHRPVQEADEISMNVIC